MLPRELVVTALAGGRDPGLGRERGFDLGARLSRQENKCYEGNAESFQPIASPIGTMRTSEGSGRVLELRI